MSDGGFANNSKQIGRWHLRMKEQAFASANGDRLSGEWGQNRFTKRYEGKLREEEKLIFQVLIIFTEVLTNGSQSLVYFIDEYLHIHLFIDGYVCQ